MSSSYLFANCLTLTGMSGDPVVVSADDCSAPEVRNLALLDSRPALEAEALLRLSGGFPTGSPQAV
eukprot:6160870-Alexandrium_andersonii.AAC.1